MDMTYLAAVLALGLNPAEPVSVLQTATALPTQQPVAGTPFVVARGHASAQPADIADNPQLGALLALGQHPEQGERVLMTRQSVVPAEAGIVGPVFQSALSAAAPAERVERPQLVDLRDAGA